MKTLTFRRAIQPLTDAIILGALFRQSDEDAMLPLAWEAKDRQWQDEDLLTTSKEKSA